jgi:hypothetical protein
MGIFFWILLFLLLVIGVFGVLYGTAAAPVV